ncbi:hypothetical protein GIB67_039728, partial [Kingdonia uniflora]
MASIFGCAKADEANLVGHLSPAIGVGDEEDTAAELIEWPRLTGSRVEYPTGSNRLREFCKAKSSIDGIWGHAFAYRGNFFRTCSVNQGGDYVYLLPDLVKEKKCRRLGDEVSLEYVQGVAKESRTYGFCCYLAQFNYGLTLPLSNLAKSVINLIGVCPAQLNCNFWEVIFICKTLNGRWAASGCEKRITAKDFLEYYAVKYVTATNGINYKVSRKESFIDVVAREGTELEDVLKELEISRFKRVASKDDKVRRSQAKMRLVGKTPGSMEEKMTTSELNIPLKLARLNKIPNVLVDMATVSSTVVQNLAKRKAVKRGATPRSVSSVSVDDSSKRRKAISPTKSQEMLEESDKTAEGADLRRVLRLKQISWRNNAELKLDRRWLLLWMMSLRRSMELEKMFSQLEGEKNQLEEKLTRERVDFQLELEKEMEAAALKLKQVRAESEAEAERLVTALAISQNNLAGKLYQLRYTKAEIAAFSEGNYEDMGIMDEEEVEERECGLNSEIENSRLRAVDLEGLLKVEEKSSAELQLSLKLEETKKQVEEKTATVLSRDLALNQLTSELAELKEKVALGSRHEAELAEYRIRTSNEEISDMK